jgi:hypothetical protein
MASPDFSNYIDLTVNDKQPDTIYNEAIDYARIALPEFSPRSGTVEDAVLQATAYMAGVTAGSINRLPNGLMEGIMRLIGVVRKEATFGSIDVEFTLSSDGLTIPAETIVYLQTTDGDITVQYPFILATDTTAAVDDSVVTATLTAQVGGILPTIDIGTTLSLAQANTVVLSAVTASAVTQGARAETETEYFNRATTYLESLSSCLATAKQVENYILANYSEVYRCKVYDLTKAITYDAVSTATNITKSGYNATVLADSAFVTSLYGLDSQVVRAVTPSLSLSSYESTIPTGHYVAASSGSSSVTYVDSASVNGSYGPVSLVALESLLLADVGDNPGYFIIFICDKDGIPVLQSIKDEIYADVASKITAGLTFNILDAFPVDIDITVTISVDAEYGASVVAESLALDLETYLSVAEWPNWNSFVRIFDIVVRASKLAGVSYVYSVTPSLPSSAEGSMEGNEDLAVEVSDGGTLLGYQFLYAGLMPRATVEVLVI